MRGTRGFSMAELMVVLLIIGLASVAMAPQFMKVWRRSDLESVEARMETRVKVCRQKAVMTRKPYRLVLDPAAGEFHSERRDSGGVWVTDPPETLHVDRAIEFASVVGGSAANRDILFEARGTVSATDSPARIRFWNTRGETLSIHLIRTGRVRVTREG